MNQGSADKRLLSGIFPRCESHRVTLNRLLESSSIFSVLFNIWSWAQTVFWITHPSQLPKMNYCSRNWMSFPEIGIRSHPEDWEFEGWLDEFSRNRLKSRPREQKKLKNNWMCFPVFFAASQERGVWTYLKNMTFWSNSVDLDK